MTVDRYTNKDALGAVRVDDALLRVSDEDLRWCKDIVGALQEAGGPTNNMRAVGLSRLIAALEAVEEKYAELIYAVASKYPGESRHETALELEQAERIAELEARLKEIGDYAHDNSTGPAVPDALWTIREMAYDR